MAFTVFGLDLVSVVLVCGMLASGSINTLAKKWQNECCAIGVNGQEQNFDQPWTQTLFMYTGESLCLLAFGLVLLWDRKLQTHCSPYLRRVGVCTKSQEEELEERNSLLTDAQIETLQSSDSTSSVGQHDTDEIATFLPESAINVDVDEVEVDEHLLAPKEDFFDRYPLLKPFLYLITSAFDLIGTTFSGIGLLYTPASVYQMLRGAIIVFSGILSVMFLKRKLYAFHWIGICTTIFGLVLVGMSSIFGPNTETNHTCNSGTSDGNINSGHLWSLFGDVMIILAQLASAIQFILEEIFLKRRKAPPLQIVGSEGVWGIFMMIFLVLPLLYLLPGRQDGHWEDSANAFVMMGNNWVLTILILTYITSIAFYNFLGLSISKKLTTVHRTFIDTCRTVLVWGIEVILFYATSGFIGQEWNNWSWLQLGGFFFLVFGTVLYNAVLKIPRFFYPTEEQMKADMQKTE